MSRPSQTTVLISGASRGLGLGLLKLYLAKPNHTVIAANRSLTSAKDLAALPAAEGSRVIVVKVDASVESEAFQAANELVEKHGIQSLDIVIANAGIAFSYYSVAELKVADLQAHIVPNVFGVVWLYQAMRPLMQKAKNPMWVTVGSTAGQIQMNMPNAAYGPSKAAVHWLTKRISGEDEWLCAFVMHPGWVRTEMGNHAAQTFKHVLGLEEAVTMIDDSVNGMLKVFDSATRESHGGRMWDFEGKQMAW